MKSVLGVLGLSLLVFSCSGNGDATFKPVGHDTSGTSSGGSADSGAGSGGSSGSSSAGSAGKGNGGSGSGSGGQGSSGDAGSGTAGGGGSGPGAPEVIYVATSGADDAQCGLTAEAACLTISQGAARALESGRADVYVQAGTYPGVAVLQPGVRVLGGFNTQWQSGTRSDDAYKVVIEGGVHEETGEYLAVWAHDLDSEATLENLVVAAPNAEGQKDGNGRSSYGIHAVSAKVALKDLDIIAGNGADGADGAAGMDAATTASTDAMNGKVGGPGLSSNHANFACNAEPAVGGLPGSNTCAASPSATLMSGGQGGYGGPRDTKCFGGLSYIALPGGPGLDGAGVSGSFGKGGGAGSGSTTCGATGDGGPGLITNGAGGLASGGGAAAEGFWYALPGGNGGVGQNGGGGGGGGGAGGCDPGGKNDDPWADDSRGAAGGGGGAGGCAAQAGGKGGGGGGGSFGVYAVGSELKADGVSIARGTGGTGGAGGVGGRGQTGGLGQSGGTQFTPSAAAGKGGNGGHGGHGGGGAGGSGGRSYGVVLTGSSTLAGTPNFSGGAAGPGGDGGVSAPNAPDGERDGNNGADGADGTAGETLDCAAETSC